MNKKISFLILAALLTLSGCRLPTETIREAEKEIDGANAPKRLTVLLTGIPANVNLLGTLSESGATIADALFDGPFDEINGEEFPVIFSTSASKRKLSKSFPAKRSTAPPNAPNRLRWTRASSRRIARLSTVTVIAA